MSVYKLKKLNEHEQRHNDFGLKYYITVKGAGAARHISWQLSKDSKFFVFEPMPDDEYMFMFSDGQFSPSMKFIMHVGITSRSSGPFR